MQNAVPSPLAVALLTLALGAFPRPACAQPSYTLTDLGALAPADQRGDATSAAHALNSAGQVVGSFFPGFDSSGARQHAFLYSDGRLTELGGATAEVFSSRVAFGVNDSGRSVGLATTPAFFFGSACVYANNTLTVLGTLGGVYSCAYGINAAGEIVGEANLGTNGQNSGFQHAFLFSSGRMTDLGALGGANSHAFAINDAGQIVGSAEVAPAADALHGWPHAFLFANGRMTDLGTLGGGTNDSSQAKAVNATGQIVGSSTIGRIRAAGAGGSPIEHAMLYANGRMLDLGGIEPDADSVATGINASGQIVGTDYPFGRFVDDKSRAFLVADGRMFDLNALVVDLQDWRILLQATGINDRGQIVGTGWHASGTRHAFLLTPRPITSHPVSQHVAPGTSVTFGVGVTGDRLSYQWKKNGTPVAGGTNPTLAVGPASAADVGFYSVVVTGEGGPTESNGAGLTLTASGGAGSRLINISTRGRFPGTAGAFTAGFVLRGTGTKQLLMRAVGPTLTQFGVSGACPDPKLEVVGPGATSPLLTNDNWGTAPAPVALIGVSAQVGAFALPAGSLDAAALASLDSGSSGGEYSMRASPAGSALGGEVLAEIYDADPPASPVRIVNLSTLAHVEVHPAIFPPLVAGFVIGGDAAKQVLIRAVGPGLAPFGIAAPLTDPRLTVVPLGQSAVIASNDNWDSSAAMTEAFKAAGAFALSPGSKDAALIARLPPGGYTLSVTGVLDVFGYTMGNVLLEIYDLDP